MFVFKQALQYKIKMAKNIIQDVIAKDRRSIRDISVNRVKRPIMRSESRKSVAEDMDDTEEREIKTSRIEKHKKAKNTDFQKMIIWIIAMLSLGFFLFSLSSYLSTATVTVTPKMEKISFDDTYMLKKNAVLSGEFQFEIMTLQKKMSKQLEATETKNLQVKAKGKIIVYNNFNSVPQKFIKNTRFESENGLIYKIPESIVVPGKTIVAGKQVPGSIETDIFADESGDKYNIKEADIKNITFKVVGLKGDRKYDYFYGRAKSGIIGGVSGLVKKVAEKTYEDALSELKAGLKSDLIKQAYSEKPESSVLLDNAFYIDFSSLPDNALGNDKIEITESATFYGIIFDKAKLSAYIASKKISNFDGTPVDLVFGDNIKINIINNSKLKPWESDSLSLNLKGETVIVWKYDRSSIQKSIAGYSKNDLNKFKLSHPEFSDVSFIVRPFWRRSLPTNPNKIKIVEFVAK